MRAWSPPRGAGPRTGTTVQASTVYALEPDDKRNPNRPQAEKIVYFALVFTRPRSVYLYTLLELPSVSSPHLHVQDANTVEIEEAQWL